MPRWLRHQRRAQRGWSHDARLSPPKEKPAKSAATKLPSPNAKIVATYDYRDTDGTLLFQAVRFEPKDFRQRKPDGRGGWTWSVKGVKQVPYRLPDLLTADTARPVFIVEGEKDADRLWSLGLIATCNAMGAAKRSKAKRKPACKWKAEYAKHLDGRDVVVLPDNDEAGRDHTEGVAATLIDLAASIKIIELPGLPEKGDVSDWLNAGGTAEQLLDIVADSPTWSAPERPPGLPMVELPGGGALSLRRPPILVGCWPSREATFAAAALWCDSGKESRASRS